MTRVTRVTQAHRDMYEEVGAVRVEGVFDTPFVARLTSQIDESIAALRDGTFGEAGGIFGRYTAHRMGELGDGGIGL